MDNHLHVLCRLDPDQADAWADEEVVRRWINVYPPKTLNFDDQKVVDKWIKHDSLKLGRVAQLRERLADLGWFMNSL